jgi:MFS family permease
MRRLLILVSAMVFLDVAFFAAIAPLLPDYVDKLDLSKAGAGILSAAYAAGTLAGALPSSFVASRVGPRRTVIAGLVLLGLASLAFGFANQIVLLDVARFVQGCAGATIWAGALTWLIAAAPEDKRGSLIGSVLGVAVAGALLGPALGALAESIGTDVVFSSVLVISLALAAMAWRTPDHATTERQSPREVLAVLRTRPVVLASLFVGMPSLMFGAIEVLAPLRIAALGGGGGVIAAGFIVGAGIEAVIAPLAGRFSDRAGRRRPYVIGVAVCAISMLVLAAAGAVGVVIASLLLSSIGAGVCFAPAMALISDVAESSTLHLAFAAGLSNLAWAGGQVIGGLGGGAVADLAGFGVASIAVAVLLLATVVYARRELEAGPTLAEMPAAS